MFALIGRVRGLREIAVNWRRSVVHVLTDSYRPELHYMRGPGPKWRLKSPA
jgi:hypothetical protein